MIVELKPGELGEVTERFRDRASELVVGKPEVLEACQVANKLWDGASKGGVSEEKGSDAGR